MNSTKWLKTHKKKFGWVVYFFDRKRISTMCPKYFFLIPRDLYAQIHKFYKLTNNT